MFPSANTQEVTQRWAGPRAAQTGEQKVNSRWVQSFKGRWRSQRGAAPCPTGLSQSQRLRAVSAQHTGGRGLLGKANTSLSPSAGSRPKTFYNVTNTGSPFCFLPAGCGLSDGLGLPSTRTEGSWGLVQD